MAFDPYSLPLRKNVVLLATLVAAAIALLFWVVFVALPRRYIAGCARDGVLPL